jgi:ubiquinone/menaquinone biosynthesis C-methylase UbiE
MGLNGMLGGLFGAGRNRERSEWVLLMLDLKPSDRVLEIGFGPGTGVQRAIREAAFVAGIDESEEMLKHAMRSNSAAIAAGRVSLQLGSAQKLPFSDDDFDKIFAIDSAQYWKDSIGTFRELLRVLKPNGWAGVAVQPRNKGATEDHAYHAGRGIADAMNKAGFREVHTESRKMKPVSTVCVLGQK